MSSSPPRMALRLYTEPPVLSTEQRMPCSFLPLLTRRAMAPPGGIIHAGYAAGTDGDEGGFRLRRAGPKPTRSDRPKNSAVITSSDLFIRTSSGLVNVNDRLLFNCALNALFWFFPPLHCCYQLTIDAFRHPIPPCMKNCKVVSIYEKSGCTEIDSAVISLTSYRKCFWERFASPALKCVE